MGWWQALLRTVGIISTPANPPMIGGLAGIPTSQTFSPHTSMASFAQFSWVRSCVDAISTDLTGLPLRIVRGEGKNSEVVDDPIIMGLLQNPTSHQSREEWEATILRQVLLSGNGYVLKVGSPPTSLPLLHCESVQVTPGRFGEPESYMFQSRGGEMLVYSPSAIVHWRLAAWENGPQGLLGEGLIRALTNDLNADFQSSKHAAKAARQGRPSAIFIPKENIKREHAAMINDAYRRVLEEGAPSMVVPFETQVEFPSFTPRDLEFAEQRKLTRETVLAAFGVPPTRVGLPTANYATSQQQDLTYWLGLVGLARLIDAGLTRIARTITPGVYVKHDFAGVPALQESRSERLDRVQKLVDLGVQPAAAAAYEGFDDIPFGDLPPSGTASYASKSLQDWWDTRSSIEVVGKGVGSGDPGWEPSLEDSQYPLPPFDWCMKLSEEYPEIWGCTPPELDEPFKMWKSYNDGSRTKKVLQWVLDRDTWAAQGNHKGCMPDDDKFPGLQEMVKVISCLKWGILPEEGWDKTVEVVEFCKKALDSASDESPDSDEAAWGDWRKEVHSPMEYELGIAIRKALAKQLGKVLSSLPDMNSDDPDVDNTRKIFAPATRKVMFDSLRRTYISQTLRIREHYKGIEYRAPVNDAKVEEVLRTFAGKVNAQTGEALFLLVASARKEGWAKEYLAERVSSSKIFSPSRSFHLAKLESTRACAALAIACWTDAIAKLGKRWVSSPSDDSMCQHEALQGIVVGLEQTFEFAGNKAQGPGHFNDTGCRCMLMPADMEEDSNV